MNPSTRKTYFRLWRDACTHLGLDPKDADARRAHTAETMRLIGGPATDSTTGLDNAAVTGLLTRLRHQANPQSLQHSTAWLDCQDDYRKFNDLRQAGHWRAKAGYKKGGKLDRDRFSRKPTRGLFDAPEMSADEARQYLMTQRARAKARARRADPKTENPQQIDCPF